MGIRDHSSPRWTIGKESWRQDYAAGCHYTLFALESADTKVRCIRRLARRSLSSSCARSLSRCHLPIDSYFACEMGESLMMKLIRLIINLNIFRHRRANEERSEHTATVERSLERLSCWRCLEFSRRLQWVGRAFSTSVE